MPLVEVQLGHLYDALGRHREALMQLLNVLKALSPIFIAERLRDGCAILFHKLRFLFGLLPTVEPVYRST